MYLTARYDNLYKKSLQHFSSNGVEVDHNIDNPKDDRYGLTLIIRPEESVRKKIIEFTGELSSIDSQQYYYPFSDIHITILSLISCTAGLKMKDIELPSYIDLINNQLKDVRSFDLKMEGVTASPSCIMVRGYPADESLNSLRNRLRSAFEKSNLPQSLDQRYLLQTAHATVVRFREPLAQKNMFLEKLENNRSQDFGTFKVQEIELVYNDWYHRTRCVQSLHTFEFEW